MKLIGATLGNHVHESTARSSELGVGPLRDDDHLTHSVEVEGERWALTTALLAEERVVEVRAIDGDVVVNAALSTDRDHVTVGSLRDGDVGCEQRKIEIIASVVRQSGYYRRGESCRLGRFRSLDGRLTKYRNGGELGRSAREFQWNLDGLSNVHDEIRFVVRDVADGPRRHGIIPERD